MYLAKLVERDEWTKIYFGISTNFLARFGDSGFGIAKKKKLAWLQW